MSPQLILHSLYTALLLNEVVDDLRRLLIFELGLRDATHVEQVLQLWVQIIQIEACVRIPSYMTDVLEVAWCPNVSLRQLPTALALLFLLVKATVQHVILMGHIKFVVYLGILDVHRCHQESGSIWWVTPFLSFPLSSVEQFVECTPKSFGFLFTGKVEAHLTRITSEGNEVGSRTTDREIIVELLLKLCFSILDIKDTDKIRPLRVVFHQTGHPTAPLEPGRAPVCPVHLDHRRAQGDAFPAQVVEQTLVLVRGQKQRAHVSHPPLGRVAAHVGG